MVELLTRRDFRYRVSRLQCINPRSFLSELYSLRACPYSTTRATTATGATKQSLPIDFPQAKPRHSDTNLLPCHSSCEVLADAKTRSFSSVGTFILRSLAIDIDRSGDLINVCDLILTR